MGDDISKLLRGLMAVQNVVPFGKHKGRPMEVLRQDPEYASWLLDNGVVSETKYRNVYVFLTGGAQNENQDTPEHNRYQVMFLNQNFAGFVFDRVFPNTRDDEVIEARKRSFHRAEKRSEVESLVEKLRRDLKNVSYNPYNPDTVRSEFAEEYRKKRAERESENEPKKQAAQVELSAIESRLADIDRRCELVVAPLIELSELPKVEVNFEVDANGYGRKLGGPADVQLNCCGHTLRIEIKPSMGDDYPAVLRQMKGNYCNVLYLGSFEARGATLDQVKKLFRTADILVLEHQEPDV